LKQSSIIIEGLFGTKLKYLVKNKGYGNYNKPELIIILEIKEIAIVRQCEVLHQIENQNLKQVNLC
jgi:hypothetical protein